MTREQLLAKLERAWDTWNASYAGLSRSQMLLPGVTGNWSIRDLIAHVTWWEEESLEHLPLIRKGGRPPRYSVIYGGIDAFNAMKTEERKGLSFRQVLRQRDETHRRLVAYVGRAPEDLITVETRFRRRLRLDTYGHYPKHARAIREWRARNS